MALTYTWQAVRVVLTLGFAAAIVSKSATPFESIGFLAALIAYHRLSFAISAISLTLGTRAVRDEVWAHRTNRLLQNLGADVSTLPASLRDLEFKGGDEGIEMVLEDLEEAKRKHRAFRVAEAVTDTGLLLAFVLMLLA
jgi:hypothetical protein